MDTPPIYHHHYDYKTTKLPPFLDDKVDIFEGNILDLRLSGEEGDQGRSQLAGHGGLKIIRGINHFEKLHYNLHGGDDGLDD